MHIPEWWQMPDFLFVPSMLVWTAWGIYALWKFALWLTPTRRNERVLAKIESQYKIRKARQDVEINLMKMKAQAKLDIEEDKQRSDRLHKLMSRSYRY